VDVWLRGNEPSPARWAAKLAILSLSSLLVRVVGRAPVRRLHMGSADEPGGYWSLFWRLAREGRWRADDGTDYLANMARVTIPTLHVVSDGDPLLAHPRAALAFTAALPRREVICLSRGAAPTASRRDAAPGHMALVTDSSQRPLWREVAGWIQRAVQGASPEE
jgi:hypothetical protein